MYKILTHHVFESFVFTNTTRRRLAAKLRSLVSSCKQRLVELQPAACCCKGEAMSQVKLTSDAFLYCLLNTFLYSEKNVVLMDARSPCSGATGSNLSMSIAKTRSQHTNTDVAACNLGLPHNSCYWALCRCRVSFSRGTRQNGKRCPAQCLARCPPCRQKASEN